MAMESNIAKAAENYGIKRPEDWCEIKPEWVRAVPGCGPSTLDHLRMYLAARGLTLKDDATPEYWQQTLSAARIAGQVSPADRAVTLDFTILVDTAEQKPFTFKGYVADADRDDRPLICPTKFLSLGPTHGDYSIQGMQGEVHIERKSMSDAHGTFLSHGERRERWMRTLHFLASIPTAAVVIECGFFELLMGIESRGKRSKRTLQKTLHRQILAWQIDTGVPFIFHDGPEGRRMAESTTLQLLRRHWRKAHSEKKRAV